MSDVTATVDARAIAIRFADLWAVDPHQMVAEIYSDDIDMTGMASAGPRIAGASQLHALEDRLAALIPDHRHELVRVLQHGHDAFLETTIVAPRTGEYAQAALWWRLGADGRVEHEIGWFDWDHRTTDWLASRGTVPPTARRPRPHAWYVERVEAMVAAFLRSPADAVGEWAAPGCVLDLVGRTSVEGRGEVERVVVDAAATPGLAVDVRRVLGEGDVVAVLVVVSSAGRATRGTVVLSFDVGELVTSVRVYLDWSRAVDEVMAAEAW